MERLTSDLAFQLTQQERAQHHLEALEASNAFVVSLGPGRQWFRYHGLLREMLQHRLRVDAPEPVPEDCIGPPRGGSPDTGRSSRPWGTRPTRRTGASWDACSWSRAFPTW